MSAKDIPTPKSEPKKDSDTLGVERKSNLDTFNTSIKETDKTDRQLEVQASVEKSASTFGYKSANLMELEKLCAHIQGRDPSLRAKVPEICPLSHDAVFTHIKKHAPEFDALWKQFVSEQGSEKKTITERAQQTLIQIQKLIREVFTKHPLPIDTDEFRLFKEYLDKLNPKPKPGETPKEELLMVRSTGKEDNPDLPNPGGNLSVAAVKPDIISISNALGEVVASYFGVKSNTQRLLGYDDITKPPFMPGLLQKMVGETVGGSKETTGVVRSGVMYTGNRGTRIQVAPGHGELIVNSKAPFDTYYVTQELVPHAEIHEKTHRLVPITDPTGKIKLQMVKNDPSLKKEPSVPPHVAQKIAQIGQYIEEYYGKPMDVEFVYNPEEDAIYLVQARPIPLGDLKLVVPTSIKPEKLAEVNDKGQVLKGTVVTPAGSAARIITSKNDVLVCQTIEEALALYLHPTPKTHIKAVIILNDAPETSHEAAQFNSKAIPVMKVDNTDIVEQWLEDENVALIVDPQRKQIINWAGQISGSPQDKTKWITDELLAVGFFKSHMAARETILEQPFVGKRFHPTTVRKPARLRGAIGMLAMQAGLDKPKESSITFHSLMQILFGALQIADPELPSRVAKFSQMAKLIENIENAVPGNANKASFEALKLILNTFVTMAHPNRSGFREVGKSEKDLFRQAMITGGEIYEALAELQTMTPATATEEEMREARGALLNLAVKLEGLITAPPVIGMSSNSLFQIALNRKVTLQASAFPGFENLNRDQQDFFVALSQLNKLALNQPLSKEWMKFALMVCQDEKKISEMTILMMKLKNYNISAEWLNETFAKTLKAKGTAGVVDSKVMDEVYGQLIKEATQIDRELSILKLDNYTQILNGWQLKLRQWANEEDFEKLYKDWCAEIGPMITSLSIDPSMHPLTQKAVLNVALRLTDLMDLTIKAQKGSPEYKNKDLQARRFAMMLEHYYQLMQVWFKYVPSAKFDQWAANIIYEPIANRKSDMLAYIVSAFQDKVRYPTQASMQPSGRFDVASCTLGSTASFYRHFVELGRFLTLEDLFTLMHQNTMAAISQLKGEGELTVRDFPEPLHPLLTALENIDCRGNKVKMINFEQNYPKVNIEYNLPLRNHSAKFYVQYDKVLNKCRLSFKIFGHNRDQRMDYITIISQLFPRLQNLGRLQEARYDNNKMVVNGAWEFNSAQLATVGKELTEALTICSHITFWDDQQQRPLDRFNAFLNVRIPIIFEQNLLPEIIKSRVIFDALWAKPEFQQAFQKNLREQLASDKDLTFVSKLLNTSSNPTFTSAYIGLLFNSVPANSQMFFKLCEVISELPALKTRPDLFENAISEFIKMADTPTLCNILENISPLNAELFVRLIGNTLATRNLDSSEIKMLLETFHKSLAMKSLMQMPKGEISRRFLFLRSLLKPPSVEHNLPIQRQQETMDAADFDKVLQLAQQELDPSFPFLLREIARGNLNMVKHLFTKKADPNARDANGVSALELAIKVSNLDLIKILLENKADPNTLNVSGNPLLTLLLGTPNTAAISLMLDHGADPNAKTKGGDPIIITTLENFRTNNTKLLLDKGANPYATDAGGKSFVNYAVEFAQYTFITGIPNLTYLSPIKLLLDENKIKDWKEIETITQQLVTITNVGNATAVAAAVGDLLLSITKANPLAFIKHWNLIVGSPAMQFPEFQQGIKVSLNQILNQNLISIENFCEIIKQIPAVHAEVIMSRFSVIMNEKDLNRMEIRKISHAYHESEIFKSSQPDAKVTFLRSLLKTNLGAEDFGMVVKQIESVLGYPILAYEVARQNEEMIKFLLDKGANPNVRNQNGVSALELAILESVQAIRRMSHPMTECSNRIIKMLLENKADPNILTNSGEPLLATVLTNAGTDVALLITHGADVNAKTKLGSPMLKLALNSPEKIRLLLDKGANPHATDENGKSIMFLAFEQYVRVYSASPIILPFLEKTQIKEWKEFEALLPQLADQIFSGMFQEPEKRTLLLLLEQGMNPNLKGRDNATLLTKALKARQPDIVRMLLQKGAELEIKELMENIATIKATVTFRNHKETAELCELMKRTLLDQNKFEGLSEEHKKILEPPPVPAQVAGNYTGDGAAPRYVSTRYKRRVR